LSWRCRRPPSAFIKLVGDHILVYTLNFYRVCFAAIFLDEKPRWTHVLIFLVAMGGVYLAKPLAGGHALGNLIALGDGAIYAALVTYIRKEETTERETTRSGSCWPPRSSCCQSLWLSARAT